MKCILGECGRRTNGRSRSTVCSPARAAHGVWPSFWDERCFGLRPLERSAAHLSGFLRRAETARAGTADSPFFGARRGLAHSAGTQATGAYAQGAHSAVGELVPHVLQVGIEAALRLYVGMAHQIADLRLFPADITLSAHDILPRHLDILRANATAGPERSWAYIPICAKRQVSG